MVRCAACLILLAVLSITTSAQVEHGQFTGVVTDSTGATITGAKILVFNLETGVELAFRTNEAGIYYAGGLLAGHYRLRSQARSFAAASSAEVILNAGTVVRVDFQLKPGQARETVEVIASPAPVNIQDGRLSAIVDSRQIANLPLNGRNVYDLVQ